MQITGVDPLAYEPGPAAADGLSLPVSGKLAHLMPLPWCFSQPGCPAQFDSPLAVRDWIEASLFSGVLDFEGTRSCLRLYVVKGRVCGMEARAGGVLVAGPAAALAPLGLLERHPVTSYALEADAARGLAVLSSTVLLPWSEGHVMAPCSVLDFALIETLTSTARLAAIAVRHGETAAIGWRVGPSRFASAPEGEEAREGTAALEELWSPGGVARICWSPTSDLPPLLAPSS
ncbi:MAG TPA: hypothetical protein VNF75_06200 [Candidatus Dormibacteraeota bacterium]|nr:hypothetical protein [Candidatus Dormibacteraeota bacterium]